MTLDMYIAIKRKSITSMSTYNNSDNGFIFVEKKKAKDVVGKEEKVEEKDVVPPRKKTMLCDYYFFGKEGKGCTKKNCTFVHFIEKEMHVLPCNFDEHCNKVIKKADGSGIDNAGELMCFFLHTSSETKTQYCHRVGKLGKNRVSGVSAKKTDILAPTAKPTAKPSVAMPTMPTMPTPVLDFKNDFPVLKEQVKSHKQKTIKMEEVKQAIVEKTLEDASSDVEFIIEVNDKGVPVVRCKSKKHMKIALELAMENKQSLKIVLLGEGVTR